MKHMLLVGWLVSGLALLVAVSCAVFGDFKVVGGSGGGSCGDAGMSVCDGGCVDTTSDLANCGACGMTCTAGLKCCSSMCVDIDYTMDRNNCGICGHGCQGGTCSMSMCQPVTLFSSADGGKGLGIAVSSAGVYWTSLSGYAVMSVGLDGSNPTTPTPDASAPSAGITLDATSVYWTNQYGNGAVMKVGLNGGNFNELFYGSAQGESSPMGIAVDATSVYWANMGMRISGASGPVVMSSGTVMKVAIGGGAPITLASEQSAPMGIAVDATSVYWTNNGGGTVMKVGLDGGAPTTLASEQSAPMGIAVDATNVYWTNMGVQTDAGISSGGGTVMKVAIGGGAPITLASGQIAPVSIAVDATSVYWTNTGPVTGLDDAPVMKVGLDGGTPTTVVSPDSDTAGADGIAVDATSVYWVNNGNDPMVHPVVMRVAK